MARFKQYLIETYMPVRLTKHILPKCSPEDAQVILSLVDFSMFDKLDAYFTEHEKEINSCSAYINNSSDRIKYIDNVIIEAAKIHISNQEYDQFMKAHKEIWKHAPIKLAEISMVRMKKNDQLVFVDAEGKRLMVEPKDMRKTPYKSRLGTLLYSILVAALPAKVYLKFDGDEDMKAEITYLLGDRVINVGAPKEDLEVIENGTDQPGCVSGEEKNEPQSILPGGEERKDVPSEQEVQAPVAGGSSRGRRTKKSEGTVAGS